MRSTQWNDCRRQNAASLSVLVQTREMWPKLASATLELGCRRIARTKFSITSFPRNKEEWAWGYLSFVRLSKRTEARSQRRTRTIAAPAWLSVCRQLVATFKRARRPHEQFERGPSR